MVAFLKDDKTPEGITSINSTLADTDNNPHPFFDPLFQRLARSIGGIFSPSSRTSATVDNVIYDTRLTELPIEEQKRQEAAKAGKAYRVPEWWRGEQANYKIARAMMVSLPKKVGPVNRDDTEGRSDE